MSRSLSERSIMYEESVIAAHIRPIRAGCQAPIAGSDIRVSAMAIWRG